MWAAEVAQIVLRSFRNGDPVAAVAAHESYAAIAQAMLLGSTGWAYLHSALRTDGKPLTRDDWRDLARQLQVFKVHKVLVDRGGEMKDWNVARWAA